MISVFNIKINNRASWLLAIFFLLTFTKMTCCSLNDESINGPANNARFSVHTISANSGDSVLYINAFDNETGLRLGSYFFKLTKKSNQDIESCLNFDRPSYDLSEKLLNSKTPFFDALEAISSYIDPNMLIELGKLAPINSPLNSLNFIISTDPLEQKKMYDDLVDAAVKFLSISRARDDINVHNFKAAALSNTITKNDVLRFVLSDKMLYKKICNKSEIFERPILRTDILNAILEVSSKSNDLSVENIKKIIDKIPYFDELKIMEKRINICQHILQISKHLDIFTRILSPDSTVSCVDIGHKCDPYDRPSEDVPNTFVYEELMQFLGKNPLLPGDLSIQSENPQASIKNFLKNIDLSRRLNILTSLPNLYNYSTSTSGSLFIIKLQCLITLNDKTEFVFKITINTSEPSATPSNWTYLRMYSNNLDIEKYNDSKIYLQKSVLLSLFEEGILPQICKAKTYSELTSFLNAENYLLDQLIEIHGDNKKNVSDKKALTYTCTAPKSPSPNISNHNEFDTSMPPPSIKPMLIPVARPTITNNHIADTILKRGHI